jgi:cell wall-associated NlpC family hydrolase
LARPVSGDAISDAKAKAAEIESQLTQAQNEMSALSQQYDEAQYHLSQITSSISATKAKIAATQQHVAHDKATLAKAAVANYITDGTAASQNPIFSGNQTTLGATTEYNQIAEGDINLSVDTLHAAENTLNAQEAQLQGEHAQAQAQVTQEQNAVAQNAQAIQEQKGALAQEQGQIAQLVQQQQEAEAAAAAKAAAQQQAAAAAAAAQQRAAAAAAAAAARASSPSPTSTTAPAPAPAPTPSASASASAPTVAVSSVAPAPPTAAGGEGAVQAAESQLGVPYVWGGETPGVGFDCSGLTAWSWGQVGVPLPHFSGAQMADSTPVPVSDLQPGDLLFYGPGGSDHVAMYVGGGSMIEAPYTGAVVWITGLRLGDGFVGAGRP